MVGGDGAGDLLQPLGFNVSGSSLVSPSCRQSVSVAFFSDRPLTPALGPSRKPFQGIALENSIDFGSRPLRSAGNSIVSGRIINIEQVPCRSIVKALVVHCLFSGGSLSVHAWFMFGSRGSRCRSLVH